MTPRTLPHARAMRQQPTPPEHTLWRALRDSQIGSKFRRRAPIEPYVVDFFCPVARLIVEVDGATHADLSIDATRTQWLEARGYRMLRVWNNEVMIYLEGVLQHIATHLPSPLPLREGPGEG